MYDALTSVGDPSARLLTADRLRQFLDRAGHDLLLRNGRFLLSALLDSRRRTGQQLPGARAGRDDEFEGIGQLALVDHLNVLTICCADCFMRFSRDRSPMTIARNRSTALVNS